jgi:peptidyl-prolyl cis-trans isomerase B (cyclophilin B)
MPHRFGCAYTSNRGQFRSHGERQATPRIEARRDSYGRVGPTSGNADVQFSFADIHFGNCTARQTHWSRLAMIHIKSVFGTIVLQLDEKKAPKTVANFLQYVREGFYDNTVFHRIIDNFVIQGGGFGPGLAQKSGRPPIENEAHNGLRNVRGAIAMARTSDPHSANSQFFINVVDNDFLNYTASTPAGWGYCVFGKITDGLNVVDRIKGVPTGSRLGHKDVPVSDVLIESIKVVGAN